MVIKNFLSLVLALSFLVFASCQQLGLKARKQMGQQDNQATQNSDPQKPKLKTLEGGEFLQSQAPRLGLILGGGGALAFGHLGFLHELEKQKISVTAIAGVEWGALIAASFALNNKANAAEWKLLKLPTENFRKSGLFSSGSKGVKIDSFSQFLDKTYRNARVDDTQVPFSCSFVNVSKEKSVIQRSGHLKNAVRNCWPSSPHFQTTTVAANLNGIKKLADELRRQGAELIVYVDVIGDNELLSRGQRQKHADAASLWIQNKDLVELIEGTVVNEVVTISLGGYQMDSYKSLRSIVRTGQLKAQSSIKTMAKQYAF